MSDLGGSGRDFHSKVLEGIGRVLSNVEDEDADVEWRLSQRQHEADREYVRDMVDAHEEAPQQVPLLMDLSRVTPSLEGLSDSEAVRSLTNLLQTINTTSEPLAQLCEYAFSGNPVDVVEQSVSVLRSEMCGLYSGVFDLMQVEREGMVQVFFTKILPRIKAVMQLGSLNVERVENLRWMLEDLEADNLRMSERIDLLETQLKAVPDAVISPPEEEETKADAAVVMLQVQDSKLYKRVCTEAYCEALTTLEGAVKELAESHGGVVVNVDTARCAATDSYCIVFREVHEAVWFSGKLQMSALDLPWGNDILAYSACKEQTCSTTDHLLWKGLRVRGAVHLGHLDEDGGGGSPRYQGAVMERCARILLGARGGEVLISSRVKQAYSAQQVEVWSPTQRCIHNNLEFSCVQEPIRPNRRGDVWRVYDPRIGERYNDDDTEMQADQFPNVLFWRGAGQLDSPQYSSESGSDSDGALTETQVEEQVEKSNILNSHLLCHIADATASQESLCDLVEALERQCMSSHDDSGLSGKPAPWVPSDGRRKVVASAVLRFMKGRHLDDSDKKEIRQLRVIPGQKQPRHVARRVQQRTSKRPPNQGGLMKAHLSVCELHRLLKGYLGSDTRTSDSVLSSLLRAITGVLPSTADKAAMAKSFVRKAMDHSDLACTIPTPLTLTNSIAGHIVKVFQLVRDHRKQRGPGKPEAKESNLAPGNPRRLPALKQRKSTLTAFHVPGIENRQRVLKDKWQKRRTSDPSESDNKSSAEAPSGGRRPSFPPNVVEPDGEEEPGKEAGKESTGALPPETPPTLGHRQQRPQRASCEGAPLARF